VKTLRIGTRGSQLALWQANTVAALLQQQAGVACEISIIRTTGDRLSEATLSQIGGKRLFVKEIEDALLAGEVDLAVHSSKDMPAVLPDGLVIGAVLAREDARDAVVLPAAASNPTGATLQGRPRDDGTVGPLSIEDLVRVLGREPRIGTSSVRRVAQLTRLFPGAQFLPIRGNLDTRLRKLDAGDFDAIVLAAAGLRRLQQAQRISAYIPADACVPAPGQGIIAIELRDGDAATAAIVERINDTAAAIALDAERAVVRRLGGGCQMPIGAYAQVADVSLSVTAVVISPDGARAAHAAIDGRADEPVAAGEAAAEQLLMRGAAEILEDVQRQQAPVEGLQP
jgi:hydroxymethylbilane synthase